MTNERIVIDAKISANVSKVWDYYNTPERITQWNQASPDWCCPSAEIDLRVGGKMKSRMEAKDRSFGFDFEATYDEINEGKNIAYTIADGRKVNIIFEDLGDETNVTVDFEAEGENPIEMQRDGWQAILDSFKSYTENN